MPARLRSNATNLPLFYSFTLILFYSYSFSPRFSSVCPLCSALCELCVTAPLLFAS